MKKLIEQIKSAIENNKDCKAEPLVTKSDVYYMDKGSMSSKKKEILALLSG